MGIKGVIKKGVLYIGNKTVFGCDLTVPDSRGSRGQGVCWRVRKKKSSNCLGVSVSSSIFTLLRPVPIALSRFDGSMPLPLRMFQLDGDKEWFCGWMSRDCLHNRHPALWLAILRLQLAYSLKQCDINNRCAEPSERPMDNSSLFTFRFSPVWGCSYRNEVEVWSSFVVCSARSHWHVPQQRQSSLLFLCGHGLLPKMVRLGTDPSSLFENVGGDAPTKCCQDDSSKCAWPSVCNAVPYGSLPMWNSDWFRAPWKTCPLDSRKRLKPASADFPRCMRAWRNG